MIYRSYIRRGGLLYIYTLGFGGSGKFFGSERGHGMVRDGVVRLTVAPNIYQGRRTDIYVYQEKGTRIYIPWAMA